MTTPAVSTSGLAHTFPTPRGPVHALRDVNLRIEPGQFFGLFGPNGAGKTTLIRILATLILPTGGAAQVHGFDVAREPARVRALIGLVFSSENSFYGRLTGRQNLEFFAALQNLSRADARRRASELFELFGLAAAADAPFQTYSTGMRQKLNVARALLHNPPVLFLDEPTKGMDVLTAATLRTLLRAELVERQRKTVVLTTHDLEEMESMCDQVGILEQGQLRAVGAPADLIREASASVVYRLELVGGVNGLAEHLAALPIVESVAIASQTESATVLDLTFTDSLAPERDLWQALLAHAQRVKIKRFGPKDDGLARLLKR
ncbi:MAG TPA: ABC transporter ATP-binding protein [Anaerolineales bacterium]|nr:ABC transporter ATP-binding protein [Anaerolineales bacterium]